MSKMLRFKKKPELSDLKELTVNGREFKTGDGMFQDGIILMDVPNTFRFTTRLEVAEDEDGTFVLIMTQFLTRGMEYWEMERAFNRIGFRDPEIEKQMRKLCDELIKRDLAYWEEEPE